MFLFSSSFDRFFLDDCSRVKLTTPNDYINASFINGLTPNSEKAYVATQAPIPRTIEDFWQMVWEQDAKIIIMLGAEVENMRVKVDRYWPVDTPADQQVKQYGEFSVALCATEVYREANVTLRELEVTFRGEKKAVHHYQYSGWPDHDVPSTTLDLRQLIYSLHSRFGTPLPHPLVLHCSAGIGRTGTFCAVHMSFQYMLEMIRASREDEIRLDLFEIVKRLREQRHGMVQSLSQYAYCYQVLIDIAADLGLLTPGIFSSFLFSVSLPLYFALFCFVLFCSVLFSLISIYYVLKLILKIFRSSCY